MMWCIKLTRKILKKKHNCCPRLLVMVARDAAAFLKISVSLKLTRFLYADKDSPIFKQFKGVLGISSVIIITVGRRQRKCATRS